MIEQQLMTLNEQHNNAIAVFGAAYWAHKAITNGDFDAFVQYIPGVITNAKFFRWHESIPDTLRRFCHLCLVDPQLVELYLGIRFSQLS